MAKKKSIVLMSGFLLAASVLFVAPVVVQAHCDTMDGPVILDARKALDKGDVTPILKWVTIQNEQEIRDAFNKTLVVRGKGDEAGDIADRYFFETLVRLHRAGEGEPFTGIKPAGTEIDPLVAASDEAIKSGSADIVIGEISEKVAAGIRERFEKVLAARKHMDESIEAGREYVEAYVEFVHYVEKVHQAASGETTAHEH